MRVPWFLTSQATAPVEVPTGTPEMVTGHKNTVDVPATPGVPPPKG